MRSIFIFFILTGCSGEPARPDTIGGGAPPPLVDPPCTDGAQRKCSIVVADHGSYVDCVVGVSTCIGGSWSSCEHIIDGGLDFSDKPDGGSDG